MEKEVTGIYIRTPFERIQAYTGQHEYNPDLQALNPENGIGDDSLSNGLMDGSPMEIGE